MALDATLDTCLLLLPSDLISRVFFYINQASLLMRPVNVSLELHHFPSWSGYPPLSTTQACEEPLKWTSVVEAAWHDLQGVIKRFDPEALATLELVLDIYNSGDHQWGKALQRLVFRPSGAGSSRWRERPSGSWVPTSGKNRWKGATNDSLFIEFLDQYENCLLSC
jgi:hypothetical protein